MSSSGRERERAAHEPGEPSRVEFRALSMDSKWGAGVLQSE